MDESNANIGGKKEEREYVLNADGTVLLDHKEVNGVEIKIIFDFIVLMLQINLLPAGKLIDSGTCDRRLLSRIEAIASRSFNSAWPGW